MAIESSNKKSIRCFRVVETALTLVIYFIFVSYIELLIFFSIDGGAC